VEGPDADTQSLSDPEDQGSMILGITFFGVVPMAACIAYIVVKIHKLRERKKRRISVTTTPNTRTQTNVLPDIGFQGKPELSTETTRHEVHSEDLWYEMDGKGTRDGRGKYQVHRGRQSHDPGAINRKRCTGGDLANNNTRIEGRRNLKRARSPKTASRR